MAEKSTIARPYAQAAFELAQQQDDLKKWSEMLQLIALIISDPSITKYIDNPEVDDASLGKLLLSICGEQLNESGKNFLRVLIENKRLLVAPEIVALFEQHRAEAERTIEAEVISAFPLSEEQQRLLADKLKKRLGRVVHLATKVDSSLVGGAIVQTAVPYQLVRQFRRAGVAAAGHGEHLVSVDDHCGQLVQVRLDALIQYVQRP